MIEFLRFYVGLLAVLHFSLFGESFLVVRLSRGHVVRLSRFVCLFVVAGRRLAWHATASFILLCKSSTLLMSIQIQALFSFPPVREVARSATVDIFLDQLYFYYRLFETRGPTFKARL